MNYLLLVAVAAMILMTACESGDDFLAENGKREGVKTTPSGLQYEVINEGDGPKPTLAQNVTVHYEGKLADGTVFDSSYDRGQPVTFPLKAVVPGWKEGLQLMPAGSTYMLYIPAEMGYGAKGSGPIPPNSTLIFKVELLDVK
jgi:FKBP-type peptidyl-prolyl cis-trans isomerase